MKIERKYEFRKFLNTVHISNRRDKSLLPYKNETEINDDWTILIDDNADNLIIKTAADLQDYFFTSMNVSVRLKKGNLDTSMKKVIKIGTQNELTGKKLAASGSYEFKCNKDEVIIRSCDARGAAQGCYYIEDWMNLREAPFLKHVDIVRTPVFTPRMIHSGWQLDRFPDAHLSMMAHAGFNAILVFTTDVDMTPTGYLDFNDLAERAASFGIDLYFYTRMASERHPDDIDAEEYYSNSYGRLFRECPKAKGIIFVGESCGFPSKDPKTAGSNTVLEEEGIRPKKPLSGYWPSYDFPQWLELMKKTIHKESPEADIVFWTYNFGYAPEKERLELISKLPEDITLLVTYEMFETDRTHGIKSVCMDYSISLTGPGTVFRGEAAAAAKRGIKLYTMSNTAGTTWDFGTIPYVPVPFQWSKRHDSMLDAADKWGLCGLMEGHHYGFYPSFISELAKWRFWLPAVDANEMIKKIAVRDFGKAAAPYAVKAWKIWSESCSGFIPSNEDQYGPARIGPSYPLIFRPDITRDFRPQEINIPAAPYAYLGNLIVKSFYHPFENEQQSPGGMRYPVEIKIMSQSLKKWEKGVDFMSKAVALSPDKKRENAEKMLCLGKFIANSVKTIIHLKEWFLLNERLILERKPAKAAELLDKIEALAWKEIKNAEDTIPLVEADSRLGWEPTMEYMTDREHLEWKICQVKSVIEYDIAKFRKIIDLN